MMSKEELLIGQMDVISDIVKVLIVVWIIWVLIRQVKEINEFKG